ncbi:SDR family oxidoreductase [Microbacterium sp. LjRoot45]|uniref:SDR family oxidoreductase n=1 Tax=Microbacterium sp. LjRoot45 TaxID=3342329 RepID=UPI003ED0A298
MSALRVLFIGGTGIISTACVAEALAQGHEVHLLHRGREQRRAVPDSAIVHTGDIRDEASVRAALEGLDFDVVAEFLAFEPEHIETDLRLFAGRTRQYIFVSSASAYQTPPTHLPITESTPLRNPHWAYSRNKIACEDALVAAYRETGFPMTIVRPSHTYDATLLPIDGGWTAIERMRAGKPVIVHGDGTSLWTITHSTDFARGFVGLFGRADAIGEPFHITGSEAPTWNQIYTELAHAAGVAEPDLVHVPSEAIAALDAEWGASLLGDKTHSAVFDTSKISRIVPGFGTTVPFARGAREIVDWYDAHPEAQTVDAHYEELVEVLVERHRPRGR